MFRKTFKKPIFVSISPNAQADDVWLALKLIFQPWKWREDKSCFCHSEFSSESKGLRSRNKFGMTNHCAICKFEGMLGEYLKNELNNTPPQSSPQLRGGSSASRVTTFESGRTALYAILLALGIKQGDEVLVQAFTCTAAVNPILWVGAKPVYVDIIEGEYNISKENLDKKITPQSRAVIVQHTFGFPARIDKILEIAKKHNLIIIEDCAHALGAEYNNQKLGTFGDAAIFSFGRSKVISSVFGGAAFIKNAELGQKIKEIRNNWQYPSCSWILQQLFHPIYLAIAKLLYNFLSIGKAMMVFGKKLGLISVMVYSIEKSGGKPPFGPAKMPNALACLGIKQMGKIEAFNEHRREIAEIYSNTLCNVIGVDLPPAPFLSRRGSIKNIYLNFPIQVKNFGIRWKLVGEARKQGIYLESWPAKDKKVVGPDNVNLEKLYYQEGSCSNAEKTAQASINLPTSPNTTIKDAKRVIDFLKDYFKGEKY